MEGHLIADANCGLCPFVSAAPDVPDAKGRFGVV